MSKSRRDISLVAISALVAASFGVAAPAQAAGELKVEPLTGSGFAVPHKDDIVLKASATGGNDSSELEDLHYYITNDGTFDVVATVDDDGTLGSTTTTDRLIDASADEDAGAIAVAAVFAYDEGDRVSAITLSVDEDTTAFDGTAATKRISVTAFVDKDDDNLPDSDEWQVTQNVDFVDWDDVTLTNVLTQPILGDGGLVTTVTNANINLSQSTLTADFQKNADNSVLVDSSGATRTYSSVRDDLKFTVPASSPYDSIAAGTYTAAIYAGNTSGDALRLGVTSTRATSATTVHNISGTADRTDDIAAIAANDTSKNVRSGSGSFVYKVTLSTSAGVAIDDKSVNLKIEETTNTSLDAATVTVNGSSLTNASNTAANDVTVAATTDAKGVATFNVSYSGLDEDEAFKITATVDGQSEAAVTLTAKDAVANSLYSADVRALDEELVIATGAQFTLTYHVLDQFGELYTGTDASVVVTDDQSDTYTGTVTNGKATVSMPGYAAAVDGDLDMSATVSLSSGSYSGNAFAHDVFVGSANAPASITISGDAGTSAAPLNLNSEATARADVRFAQYTTAPDAAVTNSSITISDVNGNGTRSQVTLSSPNLIFDVDVTHESTVIYEKGSITVWTDQSGVVDVDISSQYAGKQVLTVTAGGVTKTKDMYFGAVDAGAGTSLVLTAPTSAEPGATFKVSGLLTDDFGNPVDIAAGDLSVTYDGPGIAFGTLPTQTDANGAFSFAVLLGANDKSGTATITASYDQNSDDDYTDTLDLSTSASVTVGATPASDAKVNAGSFKGYVAVYAKGYEGQRLSAKIGNDWVVVPALASNFERIVDFTGAGVDIAVRIYIDRVLMDTINLTTK